MVVVGLTRPAAGRLEFNRARRARPVLVERSRSRRRYRQIQTSQRPASRFIVRLLPLAAILGVQAFLSVRLIYSNTAFLDEATYLGGGHQLVRAWLHGGPNLRYATYYSGAPVIYPVIVSLADTVGGLVAARYLSLFCMLVATTLAYASARRLYGTQAGYLAAAAFVTVEGTVFLGALATYDAMALMLIAVAAWLVIRAATGRPEMVPALYLAAPVMVVANAAKYASALYDPVIVALAFLLVVPVSGWRRALKTAVTLAAVTAALLSVLLAFAGPSYLAGVGSTTVARKAGATPSGMVIHESISWVGIVALVSAVTAIGLLIAWRRRRVPWTTPALGLVLAATVVLAPVNQARIHTSTSLSKHVDFGAWFGALLVGYGLAWVIGRRRPAIRWTNPHHAGRADRVAHPVPPRLLWSVCGAGVVALLVPLLIVGAHQSRRQYQGWVNSSRFIAALRPLVTASRGPVLVDDAQVPAYYLGDRVYATRWNNTFYLSYRPPDATRALLGRSAYVSAVEHGYFSIIALDWGSDTKDVDRAVASAVSHNRRYRFVTKVTTPSRFGTASYVIWRYTPSP